MSGVVFAGGGTGGHLYPAIALAAAMQEQRPGLVVHFVGAVRGVEARVLPARGLPHTLLPLLPFHRDGLLKNWRLVPAMTRVIWGLAQLFVRMRPDLVVGTGGYASGPAGMLAAAGGVPLALQEQNSFPGATTKLLARFARQVHLGFPEAESHLKTGAKTRVFSLGNPITPPDRDADRVAARARFGLAPSSAVVLVVGGSQGARALNEALMAAIERRAGEAPSGVEMLWATGPSHFDTISDRLSRAAAPWVHAVGYIDDMNSALASADIAISRAGAMGTAELLAWGIPMILVPLPTAAADHQTHNAQALAEAGAAVHLPEAGLSPDQLWDETMELVGDEARRAAMAHAAQERARPHAARDIARSLLELVPA